VRSVLRQLKDNLGLQVALSHLFFLLRWGWFFLGLSIVWFWLLLLLGGSGSQRGEHVVISLFDGSGGRLLPASWHLFATAPCPFAGPASCLYSPGSTGSGVRESRGFLPGMLLAQSSRLLLLYFSQRFSSWDWRQPTTVRWRNLGALRLVRAPSYTITISQKRHSSTYWLAAHFSCDWSACWACWAFILASLAWRASLSFSAFSCSFLWISWRLSCCCCVAVKSTTNHHGVTTLPRYNYIIITVSYKATLSKSSYMIASSSTELKIAWSIHNRLYNLVTHYDWMSPTEREKEAVWPVAALAR